MSKTASHYFPLKCIHMNNDTQKCDYLIKRCQPRCKFYESSVDMDKGRKMYGVFTHVLRSKETGHRKTLKYGKRV